MALATSLEGALEEMAEALNAAAIGQSGWERPLDQLAGLTGANHGELICLGQTPFHILTNAMPELDAEFAQVNGHHPSINSRVRIGIAAPLLAVLDEADLDTQEDMRRNPAYGDLLRRADIEYACLTSLVRDGDLNIGMTVLRGRDAGNIGGDEKRVFAAAARHFRAAVRTHLALERRAIGLTAAAFEQAGEAAFVLDRRGHLGAWSAQAEALVAAGDIRLGDGRLSLRDLADRSLDAAVARACSTRSIADPAPATVIARDAAGLAYPLEVAPLPSMHGFLFDAGALIVAKPPRAIETRAAQTAALLFGLTRAEAAVAGLLAAGVPPQQIASRQQVSIGTVRTHIHRALEKAGLRSQVELVAAVLSRM